MIKRKFFLTPLLVLIISCSNLEFVYKVTNDNDALKEKTLISISGDNIDIINSYLLSKLGSLANEPTYKLTIESISLVEAAIVEIDATASKFVIKNTLKYSLKNINKNCVIFNKKISSKILYDAKSAGYSFGTDLAEKDFKKRDLHSNIDQFLTKLSINRINLDC